MLDSEVSRSKHAHTKENGARVSHTSAALGSRGSTSNSSWGVAPSRSVQISELFRWLDVRMGFSTLAVRTIPFYSYYIHILHQSYVLESGWSFYLHILWTYLHVFLHFIFTFPKFFVCLKWKLFNREIAIRFEITVDLILARISFWFS